MTNRECLELGGVLREITSQTPNLDCKELYYAIKRSLPKIDKLRETVMKTLIMHEDSVVYAQMADEIRKKHAKQDEKGNPVIKYPGTRMAPPVYEYVERFGDELKDLDKLFEDVIKFNEEASDNFEKELDKPCLTDLFKVDIKHLYKDGKPILSEWMMARIDDFIRK
jgi:hypothetical protein